MKEIYKNSMLGSLAADALAMPVHWYYDTQKLDRDYGRLTSYMAPQNPHSDSILWRSRYIPRNARGNILHDQSNIGANAKSTIISSWLREKIRLTIN